MVGITLSWHFVFRGSQPRERRISPRPLKAILPTGRGRRSTSSDQTGGVTSKDVMRSFSLNNRSVTVS